MKDTTKEEPKNIQKEEKSQKPTGIYLDFLQTLVIIERTVTIKDSKTLDMSYRLVNKYRRGFTDEDFLYLNKTIINPKYNFKTFDAEIKKNNFFFSKQSIEKYRNITEIYGFIFLIILTKLVDYTEYSEAFDGVNFILRVFKQNENLTINTLKAKSYYYLSLITEKLGKQDEIINELQQGYRTACIEMDSITQVTLINCIIRYYLNNKNIEMARAFISKTKFIENISTNEDARYWFYIGKIEAIQMNYSDSYRHLSHSFRKAPEKTGDGFKTLVNKYIILVQLLMGEIPDIKSMMKTNQIRYFDEYEPYLAMLKIVRNGNLEEFKQAIGLFSNEFQKDGTFNLVQRIRHVVIKAGLRKINLSYSRISIKDITEKLKLENEKEAEYIIAKAIRDGVFLATINHEKGFVQSKEIKDIYSTFEPQKSYQTRIQFLNNILNDAQKGMKYSKQEEEAKNAAKDTELEEEENLDTSFHDFI